MIKIILFQVNYANWQDVFNKALLGYNELAYALGMSPILLFFIFAVIFSTIWYIGLIRMYGEKKENLEEIRKAIIVLAASLGFISAWGLGTLGSFVGFFLGSIIFLGIVGLFFIILRWAFEHGKKAYDEVKGPAQKIGNSIGNWINNRRRGRPQQQVQQQPPSAPQAQQIQQPQQAPQPPSTQITQPQVQQVSQSPSAQIQAPTRQPLSEIQQQPLVPPQQQVPQPPPTSVTQIQSSPAPQAQQIQQPPTQPQPQVQQQATRSSPALQAQQIQQQQIQQRYIIQIFNRIFNDEFYHRLIQMRGELDFLKARCDFLKNKLRDILKNSKEYRNLENIIEKIKEYTGNLDINLRDYFGNVSHNQVSEARPKVREVTKSIENIKKWVENLSNQDIKNFIKQNPSKGIIKGYIVNILYNLQNFLLSWQNTIESINSQLDHIIKNIKKDKNISENDKKIIKSVHKDLENINKSLKRLSGILGAVMEYWRRL